MLVETKKRSYVELMLEGADPAPHALDATLEPKPKAKAGEEGLEGQSEDVISAHADGDAPASVRADLDLADDAWSHVDEIVGESSKYEPGSGERGACLEKLFAVLRKGLAEVKKPMDEEGEWLVFLGEPEQGAADASCPKDQVLSPGDGALSGADTPATSPKRQKTE
mmetsp:Transcript_58626/g.143719  ORF Transcript_58626/g.143719 Transcript_58626/m.143719 type:complete len:167 (-) Transcript_58626:321-821(-)